MERKIIVISGPTASGKTDFSIILAKKLQTEIISADSRQFYKYLDIGTAKPSAEEISSVRHHFISFLEPDENYNVSRFRNDALEVCNNLWEQKKTPVLTGGSGLYIKALIQGLAQTPEPDPDLRNRLKNELETNGKDALYQKLISVDPIGAPKIDPENWKRVLRALEVYYLSGKPISQFHNEQVSVSDFAVSLFFLDWQRNVLYSRINERVDKMFERGLISEVKFLLDKGYSPDLNSLNTVGYKEVISYLQGNITLDEARELIKRNSRRYAKRQVTWFRKDENVEYLSIERNEDLYIFAEKLAVRFRS